MTVLQAFVLADHVYRDVTTGKHVVAGTFHQIDVASLPATFAGPAAVFISLLDVKGRTAVELRFVDGDDVLLGPRTIDVEGEDPGLPVEFAVQLPPLPLPRAGRYAFRLSADGVDLGEAPVSVGER